jgi:hypothetical protein
MGAAGADLPASSGFCWKSPKIARKQALCAAVDDFPETLTGQGVAAIIPKIRLASRKRRLPEYGKAPFHARQRQFQNRAIEQVLGAFDHDPRVSRLQRSSSCSSVV